MLRRLSGMLARMDPKGPAAPINQGTHDEGDAVQYVEPAAPRSTKCGESN